MQDNNIAQMDQLAGMLWNSGQYDDLIPLRSLMKRQMERVYPNVQLDDFSPGDLYDLHMQSFASGDLVDELMDHYVRNEGRTTQEVHNPSTTKVRYADMSGGADSFKQRILLRAARSNNIIDMRDDGPVDARTGERINRLMFKLGEFLTRGGQPLKALTDRPTEEKLEIISRVGNGENIEDAIKLSNDRSGLFRDQRRAESRRNATNRANLGAQEFDRATAEIDQERRDASNALIDDPAVIRERAGQTQQSGRRGPEFQSRETLFRTEDDRFLRDPLDAPRPVEAPVNDPFESGLVFDSAGLSRQLAELSATEQQIERNLYESGLNISNINREVRRAGINQAPDVRSRSEVTTGLTIGLGDQRRNIAEERENVAFNQAFNSLEPDVDVDNGLRAIGQTAAQIADEERLRNQLYKDELRAIAAQKALTRNAQVAGDRAAQSLENAIRAGFRLPRDPN